MAVTQVQTLLKAIKLNEVDANGEVIGPLTINVNAILTMKEFLNGPYTLIKTNVAGGETYKVKEPIDLIIEAANTEL